MIKKIFSIPVIILIFVSCKTIVGINKPTKVNNENVLLFCEKYGIDPKQNYLIKPIEFKNFINETILDNKERNLYLQPLQAMFFNKKGELISYHVNCNAPGFPKLNWNYKNVLATFPPNSQTKVNNLLSFEKIKPLLTNLNNNELNDYTVLIFWNNYLGSQTKRFLEFFKENLKKGNTKNINVFYVNNDNNFID